MTDPSPGLTPEIVLRAFATGIFPMAESRDDPDLFWVDPRQRGILPIDGFHVSRSLARRIRRDDYHVTLNTDFDAVVACCADRPETWINDALLGIYSQLHELGHAHSLEIRQQGELTGGVYGISLGGAFFGESMFSRRRDGSKLALAHLVDHLRRCGFVLFDTQFITSHLASLGAREISRASYRARLADAIELPADINRYPVTRDAHWVIQRSTQTS